MLNIKAILSNLSSQTGVYQMLGEKGQVLYVGKARNLKKRLASYFSKQHKDTKTLALIKHIEDIQVTITHNESDALLLECNLIKKHQPRYNVVFRDDKSYPYILISNDEPYPYIDFYRGARKKHSRYFGPYPSASSVRQTIHLIQKLFGLRLSKDRYHPTRTRPCLQYQIGMCSGSCASLISPEEYADDVAHAVLFLQGKNDEVLEHLQQKMEQAAIQLKFEKAAKLRNQIAKLRNIHTEQHVSKAHGDADVLGFADICIQLLVIRGGRILGSKTYFPLIAHNASKEEILTSFITQHYINPTHAAEALPKEIIVDTDLADKVLLIQVLSAQAQRKVRIATRVRGERKKWLEIANKSASQAKANFILNKSNMEERFNALQAALGIAHTIERVECFDVSHTMGESTQASCVVFNKEGPVKSNYRRFNILNHKPGDDTGAMHQVLLRRYSRLQAEHARLPDLILIDGGLPQLSAANKIISSLNLNIPIIGVAKGTTRRAGLETLYRINKSPIYLPSDSLALHLIQYIRDEAHRFAITGHRLKRAKTRQKSILQDIPGVGYKRRRELLRHFGGIQALSRASLDELAKVPGISQSLAKRIFAVLHKTTV